MIDPHNMSHVACHVSPVTCHMSRVTCHVSHATFFLLLQSCEAYWWRVCYQRGLPRLVFSSHDITAQCTVCAPFLVAGVWGSKEEKKTLPSNR